MTSKDNLRIAAKNATKKSLKFSGIGYVLKLRNSLEATQKSINF